MKRNRITSVLLFLLILGLGITTQQAGARPLQQVLTPSAYFPIFFTDPDYINTYAKLTPVASDLRSPVAMAVANDGSGRLFIVDQIGEIRIIDNNGDLLPLAFLDISSRLVDLGTTFDERGLLGLAFHPDYATNGRFFVYYSAPLRPEAPGDYDHTSVISEFTVSPPGSNTVDPATERIIMQIDQPQRNHNAGTILFGPSDGYLYIALGDGGGGSDTGIGHAEDWYEVNSGGNGQDLEANMLGSVLRIDVDGGDPYGIPADNPGISANYPETWAYGFRNPYRMAFDPGGEHELFLGDAGQRLWEEVSIIEAGGNYGWNVKEGAHCFSTDNPSDPDAITNCPDTDPDGKPLTDPIIEFKNHHHPDGGLGTVIIGGEVYRGSQVPTWQGNYFFGYFTSGHGALDGGVLIGIRPENGVGGLWDFEEIQFTNTENGRLNAFLLSFGQDLSHNIYLLTTGSDGLSGTDGTVFRLDPP